MNNLYDNLTILVSSCDKNSDLWSVFFQVLKKKWPDCPCRIILNTETETYSFEGFDIECLCVCKDKTKEQLENYNWSDRLLDNLKQVKTKYTLFLLEDFYIKKEINTLDVEELIAKIDKIKKFGALYLADNESNYPNYYDNKTGFYKRHRFTDYKVNATPAIWNTKAFIKALSKNQSPWEFELKCSNKALFSNKKYFCTCNRRKNPSQEVVFKFRLAEQVARGKWTSNAVEFLTSEGIDVDFSKRGIIEFFCDNQAKEM